MNAIWIILIVLIIIIIALLICWKYGKPKMMKYVTKKIMQNIPENQHPAELNLNEQRKAGKLVYYHHNKEHVMYLPYDKKMLRKVGYTVFHEMDGKKYDITQELGVPYFVSANMLGGGEIKVYKDDDVVHTFKEDEIVKF
jgi:hypothetical protein